MGMGVAGIIINTYYGSFPHSLRSAPASLVRFTYQRVLVANHQGHRRLIAVLMATNTLCFLVMNRHVLVTNGGKLHSSPFPLLVLGAVPGFVP